MRINVLAFAALALGVAAPAVANDLVAKDFVVEYKDLDLSSAKDLKVLDRRIDAASRVYCGADRMTTGSRVKGTGSAACVASARKLAKEQLAAVIERQTGKGG